MGNIFKCCTGTEKGAQNTHEMRTVNASAPAKGNKEPQHFHDNDELAAEANKIRDEARQLRDEAHKPENREHKNTLLDRANAADARASQLIYDRLNAPGRHPDGTVDLHLQFVADAVRIADESAERMRAKGISQLVLIVGKGNHSEGGKKKIHPAIVEWAQKKSLNYTEREGCIVIDL